MTHLCLLACRLEKSISTGTIQRYNLSGLSTIIISPNQTYYSYSKLARLKRLPSGRATIPLTEEEGGKTNFLNLSNVIPVGLLSKSTHILISLELRRVVPDYIDIVSC